MRSGAPRDCAERRARWTPFAGEWPLPRRSTPPLRSPATRVWPSGAEQGDGVDTGGDWADQPGGDRLVAEHTPELDGLVLRRLRQESCRRPRTPRLLMSGPPVHPLRVDSSRPVATSQIETVLSRLAAARVVPSGEKANDQTVARCPRRTWRGCGCDDSRRRATSQIVIVRSSPPTARDVASGEKARERTLVASPWKTSSPETLSSLDGWAGGGTGPGPTPVSRTTTRPSGPAEASHRASAESGVGELMVVVGASPSRA